MRSLTYGRCLIFLVLATLTAASAACNCTDPGFDRCVSTTCEDLGKNCGTIDDGCGNRISCGYCGAGHVCGLFEANVCAKSGSDPDETDTENDTNPLTGCRPSDCTDLGLECGTIGDGCGWEQTCGFCGGGTTCGGGPDPGRCGQSVCTPTTCESARAVCGSYPDGCGGVLSCGGCDDGEVCGGGGAYRCGTGSCTPNPSCIDTCGLVPDGCGGVTLCPGCAADEVCAAGECLAGADSIGTPCSSDSSCASGYCLSQSEGGWHGGYCTAPCGSNADCGEGNVCGYLDENGSGICLSACVSGAECGTGYVCAVPEGGAETACIPGGTGTGGVADPCGTGADCEGGADGLCLRPEDGFPGGYCTLTCGEGGPCPDGSACAFDSVGRGICVKLCSTSEDCSGDYRCRDVGGFFACWPAGGLGDACRFHQDCASELCLSNEPHGWPGGYCTALCESGADCGPGNQCLPYGPSGQSVCAVGCTTNADCRDGYSCTLTPSGRACLPYGGVDDGGGSDLCEGGCPEAICTSTTCGAVSAECGSYPDGCGGALACGDCAEGLSCGAGGPYACGMICVTNPICGTRCGIVADGCSDVLQCASCGGDGICSAGTCVAGASSIGGACGADSGCVSGHCLTEIESAWPAGYCTAPCGADADCGQGNICGYVVDGRGFCLDACSTDIDCRDGYGCQVLDGGSKACVPSTIGPNPGMTCGEGGQPGSCAGAICTPTDCQAAGIDCGRYPDGCGGVLYCGGCPTGEHCGGGGPYVCGASCTPDTSCDNRCGRVSDGCSGVVVCPSCAGDEICFVGQCVDGAASIGDPCGADSNCPTGQCLTETDVGWTGGYCTASCGSSADCGDGNVCALQNENGSGICLSSCTADAECRDGYTCAVPEGGSEKACIPATDSDDNDGSGQIGSPCTTTQDCAGGEDAICVSTPAGGRCSTRCSTDGECPEGSTCVTDGGVVPGFCRLSDAPVDNCSSDGDCGLGEICIQTPVGRMCGTGCGSDRDCPSGMRCTGDGFGGAGFCQAVSPGGPGGGQPGAPCIFNDDCESGICITESMGYPGGYCAQPCAGNIDCEAGELCGPGGPGGQLICMPECSTNRDCRPGYVCEDMGGSRSACVPDRGDGEMGAQCQTSADCAAGHVCVETYGGQRECKETCDGAGDCGEGQACRPIGDGLGTGTCESGNEHECSSDADCPPGRICGVSLTTQNLKCVDEEDGGVDWGWPTEDGWGGPRRTGDACTEATQCERMQCLPENTTGWAEGYCTGTCSSNRDCSTGSICGLKRVLEISTGGPGGFSIEDVTEVFGYEPGFGITFQSSSLSKLLIRMIMKWLLDSLFGEYDGQVVIGQCLKSCAGDAECRTGYRCMQVDSDGTRACIPFADGPGAVGDACGLIPDCGGGMRGYCMMNDSGYPDGYCSLNCRGNPSVCPTGSRCVKLPEDQFACMKTTPCNLQNLGAVCNWSRCEPNPSCWYWDDGWGWWRYDYDLCCDTGQACAPLVPCPINQTWECTAHRDNQVGFCSDCVGSDRCRPDYACYSPDNGHGVCHPSAKGSRGIGQPCTRIRDCLHGVDGVCFLEGDGGANEPSSWLGGYCSKNCGSCPSGSHCSLLVTGGKYCLQSCSRNSHCRSGYTCEIVAKHRSVKRFKCRTTTYRACVADADLVDVQLSSSWLCSDPK